MFRPEALAARRERLHGEVQIIVPVGWQVIGYGLLATLAIAAAFLAVGSYARVETASGIIAPDRGSAIIVPTRTGVVAALHVREGSQVTAGTPLADIRSEESLTAGSTAPERVIAALGDQDAHLSAQSSLIMQGAAAERDRLSDQLRGMSAEITSLDQQLSGQRRLVEVAADELAQLRGVVEKGFVSRRDLQRREEVLLTRRQQLAALEQQRAGASSSLAQARRSFAQVRAQAEAQAASVASNRASVAQRLAEADAARGYALTAPIAGRVTAVTARVGQPALPQRPLMTIIPDHARLEAQLYVPTRAIGFLAPGQDVRLAIEAFPYQRFGTVTARIRDISDAAVARGDAGGQAEPVYLVTATIAQPWIAAFGRHHRLSPDMTLSARITTEKRSLFEWLFEPVLAMRQR